MKPLQGRKVLITRARHQAGSLASALEEAGAQVLAIPSIEIVAPDSYAPLDAALAESKKYQWLILTSVNGVAVLAQRMEHLGLTPSALLAMKVAAIGPATARALQVRHIHVDVLPPAYVAESLVDSLGGQVHGNRVLLIRAKVARDVVPLGLQKAGAFVDVIEAYQTVVPAESCAALQEVLADPDRLPDVVSFTSSSTVTNFFRLMRQAGICVWPAPMIAASIGPITSQTLREHGIEPGVEAKEFTIPGLVQSICQWGRVHGS
ncbi:MAG TPA: uroporphyrinogen-III synthase [Acidobacteriaceae bacterium]|nr:uroporphyrinogen-III synthase [Acidobacteriaceae bacterium]